VRYPDITNYRFGRLVALSKDKRTKYGGYYWKCKCDCGKETVVLRNSLTSGATRSCGCLGREASIKNGKANIKNIKEGTRFEKLVVMKRDNSIQKNIVYWSCKCDCGGICSVAGWKLRKRYVISCGCTKRYVHNNITQQRFGKLVAIKPLREKSRTGSILWECICDCGNTVKYSSVHLKAKGVKSCGCLQKEIIKKIGKNNLKSIQGRIFGKWKVVSHIKYGYWLCRCECGKEANILKINLVSRKSTQCDSCRLASRTSKISIRLLNNIEKVLQIQVVREHKIENRYFDGYIPQLGLLIESDGSYWHSSNIAKKIDKEKDKLAKQKGLDLIRVQNDSEKDIEKATKKIFKYLYNNYSKSFLQENGIKYEFIY